MQVDFKNLELIPQLLTEIKELKKDILNIQNKNKLNLTKLQNVAKYLQISKTTVFNYIKDGRFKENVHYKKIIVNKMVKYNFVESAIIQFKENL